ncbi:884_t:CDS:1, partial [Rhizophagus irregularis]
LELEHAKEDRNSKEYTIECMEKGIESSNNIFKREIDALYSARSKLREENRAFKDQLALKKNTSSQIISSEGDSFGIGWRRSSTIVPRNTSSTGYSCRCEFSNVSDDNIFYACLTTDCGYMARGQEMVESMGYE